MSDDDPGSSRPNLEPPRLFGRARRADDSSEPEDEEPTELELPPEGGSDADDEPTAVEPFSDSTWMFEPLGEDEPQPEPDPEPPPEPVTSVLPAEAGTPLFADEVEEAAPPPRRERKDRRAETTLPSGGGWVAAALTGVAIGLLLVGMTAGALKGCESVRGTSTCGGWGVPLLLIILVALIVLGGLILRLFHVPDPVTTSFLAVGMVAVIALLALLDVLLSPWMLVVIPAISLAMYLLAYWVTTAFVEPAKEPADR
jgi:hypothetical protein